MRSAPWRTWLAAAACAVFLATAAQAAALSISAQVDRNEVALNEQVQLEVDVSGGASIPDPQLPSLPNFTVYNNGRSQSISFVNGSVSSTVIYNYTLTPRFVGRTEIGPISVTDGSNTAATSPINIQVDRPGGAGSSPAPQAQGVAQQQPAPQAAPQAQPQAPQGQQQPRAAQLFVQASVDKAKVYVNQQITLSIRFYTAVSLLGNPDYEPPDLSGFFNEDLPPLRNYQVRMNGHLYYVTEVKTALFPATAGKHVIGPATVTAAVQGNMSLDPFAADFFQRFLQGGGLGAQKVSVHTDPITINALPLPDAGRPPGFSGAVGHFDFSGQPSRRSLKVGEALDLDVTLSGRGNLKAVFEPKLPELKSFRVYDTASSLNLKKEDDIVSGSKEFKTVLVPRASGPLTLPGLSFSYFDPDTKTYVVKKIPAQTITVAPGESGSQGITVSPTGPAPGAVAVESDIEYIRTATLQGSLTRALTAFGRLGRLHALPLLALLGCWGVAGLRLWEASRDPRRTRAARALGDARRRLKSIRGDGADPAKVVPVLEEALANYLADKLALSPNGLTLKQAAAALKVQAPKLAGERLNEIQTLWEELEALRYAPALAANTEAVRQHADRLEALFAALDKEIRL